MTKKPKARASNFARHRPFLIAAGLSIVVLAVLLVLTPSLAIEGGAIVFFLTYLTIFSSRVPHLTAAHLKAHADSDDLPAIAIIVITFLAVAVSVASLFVALNHSAGETVWSLALAFLSVFLGWLTIHTMTAAHYAHLFWRPSASGGKMQPRGGMDFPGTEEPGIHEFLYFSIVIGMTAQTSDVAVTRTSMRKVVLAHSIVSFFFNTVLVAAAVNAAVSLAG